MCMSEQEKWIIFYNIWAWAYVFCIFFWKKGWFIKCNYPHFLLFLSWLTSPLQMSKLSASRSLDSGGFIIASAQINVRFKVMLSHLDALRITTKSWYHATLKKIDIKQWNGPQLHPNQITNVFNQLILDGIQSIWCLKKSIQIVQLTCLISMF
jgi:hypothetical protein